MTDSRSIYITANDPISDLDGWDWNDGREDQKRETCAYIWLIHFIVQQKLIQHCKAILLSKFNLKKNLTIYLACIITLCPYLFLFKYFGVTTASHIGSTF